MLSAHAHNLAQVVPSVDSRHYNNVSEDRQQTAGGMHGVRAPSQRAGYDICCTLPPNINNNNIQGLKGQCTPLFSTQISKHLPGLIMSKCALTASKSIPLDLQFIFHRKNCDISLDRVKNGRGLTKVGVVVKILRTLRLLL